MYPPSTLLIRIRSGSVSLKVKKVVSSCRCRIIEVVISVASCANACPIQSSRKKGETLPRWRMQVDCSSVLCTYGGMSVVVIWVGHSFLIIRACYFILTQSIIAWNYDFSRQLRSHDARKAWLLTPGSSYTYNLVEWIRLPPLFIAMAISATHSIPENSLLFSTDSMANCLWCTQP